MSVSTEPIVVGRRVILQDDFLPASLADDLLDRLLNGGDGFDASSTRRGVSSHRRSLQFSSAGFGGMGMTFLEQLDSAFVEAAATFDVDSSTLNRLELSTAAWTTGCYYRQHRDQSLEGPQAARRLSAVVFLHSSPRGFSGGELSVTETLIEGRSVSSGDAETVIEPDHNRMVIFDSRALHEVHPVEVPSGEFADSRFSLTAWAYGA